MFDYHRWSNTMRSVYPGRILKDKIEARGLSANALALALRTPPGCVTDILNGRRGVSPETAPNAVTP